MSPIRGRQQGTVIVGHYPHYINKMTSTTNNQNGLEVYGPGLALSEFSSLDSDQDYNRNSPYVCHMDAPVSTEQAITTEFVDDGVQERTLFGSVRPFDTYGSNFEDIKDFMAKPHLVNQCTWHTSDGYNAALCAETIEAYLGGNNISGASPVTEWVNKLQGFNLCRGTAVIKMVLNATPFQQGKLVLSFFPNYSERTPSAIPMYFAALAQHVQKPNVILDCRESSATLEIPYVNSYNFFSLIDKLYGWGSYSVNVLSPLSAGASAPTTADISIYLSFKDFELAAPICAQSNRVVKSVVSKEAEVIPTGGPVSTALRSVKLASDALSTIPSLSAITKKVSWAADISAGVASWFGFSKPTENTVPTYVVHKHNRYQSVSDGIDTSVNLTLRSDNALAGTDEATCRDLDEMSFEFLKKIPFYGVPNNQAQQTIQWAASTATNVSLFASGHPCKVGPSYMQSQFTQTSGTHVATYNIGAPVYYLSQFFKSWRGSFKVKLMFVKTQFHTGRLQITFTPTTNTGATLPDTSTSMLSLREIVDIRFCDEVELTLPYLIQQHYLQTDTVSSGAKNFSGFFDIRVLNELRAPETCAQSIDVVMFWTAGDDFEYNNIVNTGLYMPVYQSHATPLLSSVIGDAFVPPITTKHAELTHGEMFRDIKQILMCYHPIQRTNVPSGGYYTIYPWFIATTGSNATGALRGTNGGDPFNNLAAMYGFYRGSMRVAVTSTTTTVGAVLQDASQYPGTTVPVDSGVLSYQPPGVPNISGQTVNNSTFYVDDVSQNYRSYNVPYMGINKASFTRPDYTGLQANYILYDSAPARVTAASSSIPTILRATGDDFQLSYFICCPPLLLAIS